MNQVLKEHAKEIKNEEKEKNIAKINKKLNIFKPEEKKEVKKKEIKGKEIIKDDELVKIEEFRQFFQLNENDYSNLDLVKILRKNDYDFEGSFVSLFNN